MKKSSFLFALLLAAPIFMWAQMPNYNVVFDLTSKDTALHSMVLRWINSIQKDVPDAQVEVVFYGQSLDMVRNDRSLLADQVTELAKNKNVTFAVCAQAMKRHKVDKSQLLPGIKTVPDGIYELVAKQREGWGYIKVVQ